MSLSNGVVQSPNHQCSANIVGLSNSSFNSAALILFRQRRLPGLHFHFLQRHIRLVCEMKDKNRVLAQWILKAVRAPALISVGTEPKGCNVLYCKTATGKLFVRKYIMRP